MNGQRKFQRFMTPIGSLVLPLLSIVALLLLSQLTGAIPDLRENIINGLEPCFHFTPGIRLFQMNCSVIHWQGQGYAFDTHISLSANETFDGNSAGATEESYIDLSGVTDFEGLFKINDQEITTFPQAPVIRNVHVRNGQLATGGGFIVRREQRFFIVDSCSSTGDINKNEAGGICGYWSGRDNGEIKILNSHSTGKILGWYAGGIAGFGVGYNGGTVDIDQCHSTGNIEGFSAGGICGNNPGLQHGKVYIRQSYSTGDIVSSASRGGGIVGESAGRDHGYVYIKECYTTGRILAQWSGGISGSDTANKEGEVHIIDCYARGDIEGAYSGGITGSSTGGCCSDSPRDYGHVYIHNTYAAGIVKSHNSAGIIGNIHISFQGHTIHVEYTVYNNEQEGKLAGEWPPGYPSETGNSDDLSKIRGQIYHYNGMQRWGNNVWAINGTNTLPILRFQLPDMISPSTSPTPSVTSTPTSSATGSFGGPFGSPAPTSLGPVGNSTHLQSSKSSRVIMGVRNGGRRFNLPGRKTSCKGPQ